MQKTIVFGKTLSKQSTQRSPTACHNCQLLTAKLQQLNLSSYSNENINDNDTVKHVQGELVTLSQKYCALKKRIELIQQDNFEITKQNKLISNELVACKKYIQKLEKQKDLNEFTSEDHRKSISQERNLQMNVKKIELEVMVWKEKTEILEKMNKDQSDQIVRLKEFLRKRREQQQDRHKLLEMLVF